MKTKRLVFISCFAAAALIASPAWSAPRHKAKAMQKKVTYRTTEAGPKYRAYRTYRTPTYRYGSYGSNWGYGSNRYYYGGGFGYPYYGYSSWPYSYYGYGYAPYSYYSPYRYSYYRPAYGYGGSVVARVQSRLAQLGYYRGAIDGIIGPRTRGAIIAYESRHGLRPDGMIDSRLLARLGVA